MNTNLERATTERHEFSTDQYVSYALKGIYQIKRIETLSLTGTPDEYYILDHAFNKTIHKMFVPVKTAKNMGMRPIVNGTIFEQLEEIVCALELNPEKMSHNSNKKIKSYEMRIKKQGFSELIHAYFCVAHDIKITKREDRRYVQFLERLRDLICDEMTLATSESQKICQQRFSNITKKYQSL